MLETRGVAGREQVLTVLSRLIMSYPQPRKSVLLEPARGAVQAILERMGDEAEDVSLRIQAMNQWSTIRPLTGGPSRRSTGNSASSRDELHASAQWIVALGGALNSPTQQVRQRALEILIDSLGDSQPDSSLRDAWPTIVRCRCCGGVATDRKGSDCESRRWGATSLERPRDR